MISLENDWIKADFSHQDGRILRLCVKHGDWQVIERQALTRGLRLIVPKPDRLNHIVMPCNKSTPQIQQEPYRRLNISWPEVVDERGQTLPIAVHLWVRLEENSLVFNHVIDNQSPYPVENVLYPYLGEISRPKSVSNLTRYNLFYCGLQEVELFPHFRNEWGYWAVDHPIQMVPTPDSLFTLVQAGRQGLYFGYHDQTSENLLQFTFRSHPGYADSLSMQNSGQNIIGGKPVRISFEAESFPFVAPGEKYLSPDFVMASYQGTWHAGVDIYKEWRKTWYQAPCNPDWVMEPHSWQQLHINSMTDELRYRYDELTEIGAECAQHGVKAIQLVGWTDHGQDGRTPTNQIDPRLGSQTDLKEAIKTIQDLGVRIILYSKYTFADVSTDWYQNELKRFVSRDIFGNELTFQGYGYQTPAMRANINTRRLGIMCMHHPEWQRVTETEFKRLLELNADGVLYDENMHHGIGRYCFAKDHHHKVPSYNFSGDVPLARKLHQISDPVQPDFLYAGEACFDLEHTCYGLSYFRISPDHLPGQRYVDPFLPLAVAVSGFDDREMINLCLLYRYILSYEPYNFKGRLEDFPLTLEYGKKVDALRTRYRNFLWDAEFKDTLCATLVMNDKDRKKTRYAVYETQTGTKAIIIANQSSDSVILEGIEIESSHKSLHVVSPEEPDPRPLSEKCEIQPRSAIVILEYEAQ
jgi:hypothetical protein